jgi:DeoR family glycerol-3-phosphate regulon repressor
MAQNSRQQKILDLVRQRGFMSIEALADHFSVTPQTIRRDINQLSDRELLQRYHGGAGLPSSVENIAYQTRQVQCLEEKRRIAQLVARHIPNDASLFINIGTTTEEVARALLNHRGLRVITNNLHVASIMSQNAGFEVIVAGGVERGRDRGIVGETTIDFLGQFKADFGIIGISGIDADGSCLISITGKCALRNASSPIRARCSSSATTASSAATPWCASAICVSSTPSSPTARRPSPSANCWRKATSACMWPTPQPWPPRGRRPRHQCPPSAAADVQFRTAKRRKISFVKIIVQF